MRGKILPTLTYFYFINVHSFFRYLDIFLGLIFLLSMLSLLYSSHTENSLFIIMFLILSVTVVVVYWSYYLYMQYAGTDYPVFQEKVNRNFSFEERGCSKVSKLYGDSFIQIKDIRHQ